jgi:hypothetical protein
LCRGIVKRVRRAHRLLFLLAPFLCLWSLSAQGQETDREDAQLLFDEGLRYMLEGDLKMGCALIKRSLDVEPKPGTIFTLAECYARAGKVASAVQYYDEFLNVQSRLPAEEREKQRARAEVSQNERSRLVKQVPWITVILPEGAPEGVVVTMDDEPFPSTLFGVAIAVDPGKHWFTARIPGGPLARSDIEVRPATRRTHVLDLHQTPGDGNDTFDMGDEATDTADTPGRSPWVYVLGGIGIAGLATGAVTGALLLRDRSTILAHCDQQRPDGTVACDTQEAVDAARRAQNTLAPITTVALGVGAGALVAATILWFVDAPSAPGSERNLAVGADFGPAHAGFSLSGRF